MCWALSINAKPAPCFYFNDLICWCKFDKSAYSWYTSSMKIPTKLRYFISRFGRGELLGTVSAFLWWFISHQLWNSVVATAFVATRSENIGYYWYFIYREYLDQRVLWHHGLKNIRNILTGIIWEFWVWELFDSFVTRPGCMFLAIRYLGPNWWLLAWKIAADIVFYIPTAIAHHIKIHYRIDTMLDNLTWKVKKIPHRSIVRKI